MLTYEAELRWQAEDGLFSDNVVTISTTSQPYCEKVIRALQADGFRVFFTKEYYPAE